MTQSTSIYTHHLHLFWVEAEEGYKKEMFQNMCWDSLYLSAQEQHKIVLGAFDFCASHPA
jgi:hypothetical protein